VTNEPPTDSPLELESLKAHLRATRPNVELVMDLASKGLVRDPVAVTRLLRELVQGAGPDPAGHRVTISTRDVVRVDHRKQAGHWIEVVVHEPVTPTADARARISTTLLMARARLAATMLISGDGRIPSIEVDSAPTHGTVMRLILPATDPANAAGAVVLVADDDETIRQAVSEALRCEGYQVISAANGQAALDRATGPVAVLITDIVMPGMSGIELAKRLQAKQPDLKVVFMSGLPLSRGTIIPGTFVSKSLDLNVLLQQLPALVAGTGARPTRSHKRPLAAS
jgi:hypothetical protein